MRTCVVKGCKSKSSKGSPIRFHTFPNEATRRQLWWSKIQAKRNLKEGTTICELHFKPEDYDDRNRLRQDAVPEGRKEYVEDFDSRSVVEEVCRICLASDRKVFDLRDRNLKQAYNDVTGMTITSDDHFPLALCWECRARVLSAAACQNRARTAQDILERLLNTYGSITKQAISSINRREKNIATQLSNKYINSNDDYIYISEDPLTETNDIKPLHRVDIKNETWIDLEELIDESHDSNDFNEEVIKEIEAKNIVDVGKENAKTKDDENGKGSDVNDVELNDTVIDDVECKNNYNTKKKEAAKRKKEMHKRKENTTEKIKLESGNEDFLKDFTVIKVNEEDEILALERRKEKMAYKIAIYKCEVCYRGYMSEARYRIHLLKHTDKYGTFECSMCKVRYKNNAMLQHHRTSVHYEKYRCNKCDFVAIQRSTAQYHAKFHDGTKYQCPHCPRQFEKRTTYYSHLRLKHACAEVCEYCGHTFLNKIGASRHKNIVHKFEKDTKPLEGPYCAACNVKFASQEAHDKHLIMSSKHRKEDESPDPITNAYHPPPTAKEKERKRYQQPIDCEQCGITLRNKSVYAGHFNREHRGETRTRHPVVKPANYMCDQCGRKFPSLTLLEYHKWVHTGEKKFKCDICDKKFTQKGNLVLHMKLHVAARPSYECPLCGKHFAFFNNRKRHMFIHTGLKPFKCETCGKSFTTSGEQRAHVEHVHLKKPWPRRQRTRDHDQPSQKCVDTMED